MPSRNSIEIVINADDNASGVLNNITGNLQSIGGAALGAVTAGLAAGTVAVGAFATQSLQAFTSFESGISEVFTLLPGITEETMSQMESSVQGFMERTGRVSEETLPALYQALSAGVPQDNVFEFLELANEAAIGGVTDLETAVDGISSVINAYGTDVLSATEASDLMFTAVRLGKTDFEQLSASLFNVVPVASAVGVGFADITAGLATITAQGVPTSVATTQLRQLFVELADSGTEVGQIFEQVAGQSFSDFIAAGNTTADALGLLASEAESTGIPLQQMFGSIEAGQAALALTGTNMQTFIDNTNAMADSAGATTTAFEQMNDSMQQSVNLLRSRFQSALISTGRLLAPFVQPIVDVFSTLFAIFAAAAQTGDEWSDWIADLPGFLQPIGFAIGQLGAFLFNASNAFAEFVGYLQSGVDPLTALQTLILQIAGADAANAFRNLAIGAQDLFATISNAVSPVIQWLQSWITLQDVLVAIGLAIAAVVIPAIAGLLVALAPVIATFAALVAGVALLRNAWENNFLGIRDTINNDFIPAMQNGLTNAQNFFSGLSTAFQEGGFSGAGNFIMDNLVTPIVDGLTNAWNNVDWSNVATTLFDLWGAALNAFITAELWIFNNIVFPVFNKIIEVIGTIDWGQVGTDLMNAIGNGLSLAFDFIVWVNDSILQPLLNNARTAIENVDWFEVGQNLMNAIGNALMTAFNFVIWLTDSIFAPITDNTDEATGQIDWTGVGQSIMDAIGAVLGGVFDFINWLNETIFIPMIAGAGAAISSTDWTSVGTAIMNALANSIGNVGQWAQTNIITPLQNSMSNFNLGNAIQGAGNFLGGLLPGQNATQPPGTFGSITGLQFGGNAIAGRPYLVGESGRELFIPSQNGTVVNNQDTESALGGRGGVNINFNFTGRITEDEAKRSARVIVDELQALGVPIN